jgi:hypothetical protein
MCNIIGIIYVLYIRMYNVRTYLHCTYIGIKIAKHSIIFFICPFPKVSYNYVRYCTYISERFTRTSLTLAMCLCSAVSYMYSIRGKELSEI